MGSKTELHEGEMETLIAERRDLTECNMCLQREAKEAADDLRVALRERDTLQDSLQETSEVCLQLQDRLVRTVAEKERAEARSLELETDNERLARALTARGVEVAAAEARAADTLEAYENLERVLEERRAAAARLETRATAAESEVSELLAELEAERRGREEMEARAEAKAEAAADRECQKNLEIATTELREAKDKNVVLEEAIQDIQVEKVSDLRPAASSLYCAAQEAFVTLPCKVGSGNDFERHQASLHSFYITECLSK